MWKKWSFWLKALVVVLTTFLISEIILRFYGYTGIISSNALAIIAASSRRLVVLLDNVILFVIVLFIPVILSQHLTNKIPEQHYKYSVKGGPLSRSIISVKTPSNPLPRAEGKGLIYGSFIGITYTLLDYFIIKQIIPGCTASCGLENLFSGIFSLVYLSIGIYLFRKIPQEKTK